jgi:DNA adenine methylase
LTREHFYHVGGSEDNRNPMIEALVTSFVASSKLISIPQSEQLSLLADAA